ncbi:MAG: MFS transporter [Proteobacteria bacterium]|nr:MFS transporter [Pseudomonadota bacterium]
MIRSPPLVLGCHPIEAAMLATPTSSPPERPSSSEMLIVLILAGVQFSHLMDFIIMMPLGPQLMRVFHISPREFGLVVSVYTFSAACSCFFAALFMDRFDRKKVLLTIYAGLTVGTFLCGFAPSFGWLLAARVLTGLFGGLLQAIILAIIGDVIPQHRRGRATGLVMAAFAVTSVAGVPLGLMVANSLGWNATFLLLGGFTVCNLGLAWRYLPSVKGHLAQRRTDSAWSGIARLLGEPNTWVAIALTMSMMSIFALMPFVSPFLVAIAGLSEADLPHIYLVAGLASLFMAPLVGRLSDRFGARRVFIISSFFSVPALLAFAHMGHAGFAVALVLNTLVSAVGAARMTPWLELINRSVDSGRRGSFMTLIASVQQLAAAGASYGGGWMIGANSEELAKFSQLGIVVAASMIASSILSLLLRPVVETPAPA